MTAGSRQRLKHLGSGITVNSSNVGMIAGSCQRVAVFSQPNSIKKRNELANGGRSEAKEKPGTRMKTVS